MLHFPLYFAPDPDPATGVDDNFQMTLEDDLPPASALPAPEAAGVEALPPSTLAPAVAREDEEALTPQDEYLVQLATEDPELFELTMKHLEAKAAAQAAPATSDAPAAAEPAKTAAPAVDLTPPPALPLPEANQLAEAEFTMGARAADHAFTQMQSQYEAMRAQEAHLNGLISKLDPAHEETKPYLDLLTNQRAALVQQGLAVHGNLVKLDGLKQCISQAKEDAAAIPTLKPYQEVIAELRYHGIITPTDGAQAIVGKVSQALRMTNRMPRAANQPSPADKAKERVAKTRVQLSPGRSGVAGRAANVRAKSTLTPEMEESLLNV